MAGNGRHGLDGLFPGPQPAPMVVAQPLNGFQLTSLMAAILMAREPIPAREDEATRNDQAALATLRAIDILGHAAYQTGRGLLDGVIKGGEREGQAHLKAALEAEKSQVREPLIPGDGT